MLLTIGKKHTHIRRYTPLALSISHFPSIYHQSLPGEWAHCFIHAISLASSLHVSGDLFLVVFQSERADDTALSPLSPYNWKNGKRMVADRERICSYSSWGPVGGHCARFTLYLLVKWHIGCERVEMHQQVAITFILNILYIHWARMIWCSSLDIAFIQQDFNIE